jgi:hypothetical protein
MPRPKLSKDTGVVDYLDCVLVPGRGLPGLDPKRPIAGTLKVDGVQVTKHTTKAALRLQDAIREIVLPWNTGQPALGRSWRLHPGYS